MLTRAGVTREARIREPKEEPEKPAYDKITLGAAVKDKQYIQGKMMRWVEEKGYGFANTQGKDIFIHLSSIRGGERVRVGKPVILKIISDPSRGKKS